MLNVQLYNVAPRIPKELKFLEELSYNLWWCWNWDAIDLFRKIDIGLWRQVRGNTRQFLTVVPQSRLEELSKDESYMRHLKIVEDEFHHQVKSITDKHEMSDRHIAYFSLEYGLHESVRLYSGGLGLLAGDHLKAAAGLKIPLVAVGLLYREGYFMQTLDRNGMQVERYPENEINHMPLSRVCDHNGEEMFIKIPLLDTEAVAAIWKMEIGCVTLILLDTELPQNRQDVRDICGRLYCADRRQRLHQELLLGVGGFNVLTKMGMEPSVCHMNEGHAAFLSLARIAYLVKEKGLDADTALEVVWRTNVFTTHTPVPAGNETFDTELVRPYLEILCADIGMTPDRIINWAVGAGAQNSREFSMTILGLRMANYSNGVSRLHGEVARSMWSRLWPQRPQDEIPIGHITNGVHIRTWVAIHNSILYNHYLGSGWDANPPIEKLEAGIDMIPDEELWMSHELCRHSMVRHARRNLQNQFKSRHLFDRTNLSVKNALDPDILTIGFARRFATYKRANLLFRDPARLEALVNNPDRPVQFIFAGKAHPADDPGKEMIRQVLQFAQRPGVRNRVVFLEDYDISVARYMVQGVDVWLNTPRRPQEASGTSGMKAAINGVLHCSILDGWWVEGYEFDNNSGWAIPSDEESLNPEEADANESMALFNLLENEVVPCFYERSEGDIPKRWIKMMKKSIKMGLGLFSSTRMVQDYESRFYKLACNDYAKLMTDNASDAVALVNEKRRLVESFPRIYAEQPHAECDLNDIHTGDSFQVSIKVYLADLKPEEVDVEIYYGPVNVHNTITSSNFVLMKTYKELGDGNYLYTHKMVCDIAGRFGMTGRITPFGDRWTHSIPGFMKWSGQ
ncbi:MAG: glycosyltransferase family 1 protein [Lentisphaerae bacterium]|nr:alpha-glucan family phosphorylase [Victivallaceae bacterium]MDD3704068.1 alpha-glucan family phosphorylase [Victivallaceae bacterium]MDD5663860.1 alpha-glucan family phosphorylase [Victivallaceae bacterium]NLK83866.1 glycosyltransferase family 1 protein [Lentisphaerota bacterium]